MKGNFSCIIQPFLFYSAFQDKVGFTASTKLFQRQTAGFVECIFQQTSYLVFQALGPAWRQSSIRHACPTGWRKESILETNQTCRPTWAPHLLTSCFRYFSEQRSWIILWWNIPFCGYFRIQLMPYSTPKMDYSVHEGQKHITENRMLNL